jgi:hypothetical protein
MAALCCLSASAARADLEQLLRVQPRGPSFDCRIPRLSVVERRICAEPALGALDLAVNDVYAQDAFESRSALAAVAAQSDWLQVRDRCTTDVCLTRVYRERLAFLRRDYAATEKALGFQWRRDVSKNATFTSMLARLAGARCFHVREQLDLGDGRASYLGYSCDAHPHFDDHFIVFHPRDGSYEIVLTVPTVYVSGLFSGFQLVRSHGLRRIEVFTKSSCCEFEEELYDFDGRQYQPVADLDQRCRKPHCELIVRRLGNPAVSLRAERPHVPSLVRRQFRSGARALPSMRYGLVAVCGMPANGWPPRSAKISAYGVPTPLI